MCTQVYEELSGPTLVIATAPCPSAQSFWDEAPLAWMPVRELLPVDLEIASCVSGEPESLLGALLPLVNSLEDEAFQPVALQQTGA